MKTDDKTLIEALRILSRDIQSQDEVANTCLAEAANRLSELTRDDMVLVPRYPTKRMVQFGVDNREDGGGVTDIYIAMIHGYETEE